MEEEEGASVERYVLAAAEDMLVEAESSRQEAEDVALEAWRAHKSAVQTVLVAQVQSVRAAEVASRHRRTLIASRARLEELVRKGRDTLSSLVDELDAMSSDFDLQSYERVVNEKEARVKELAEVEAALEADVQRANASEARASEAAAALRSAKKAAREAEEAARAADEVKALALKRARAAAEGVRIQRERAGKASTSERDSGPQDLQVELRAQLEATAASIHTASDQLVRLREQALAMMVEAEALVDVLETVEIEGETNGAAAVEAKVEPSAEVVNEDS